jgi:hypothetical protein
MLIFFVLGSVNLRSYYRLAQEGIAAKGTVEATNCSEHSAFTYRFSVNEHMIDGHGTASYVSADCGSLKPGDTVSISYLPADPKVNVPGNPRGHLENEAFSVGAAAIILPLFLLGIYKFKGFHLGFLGKK